jgi:hypothetical protein
VDAVGRPTDCFAVAQLTVLRHCGDCHSGDAAAWSVPLRAPWALPTTERMASDFKLYIKKTLRIHENHNRAHFSYFYRRMALGRSAGDMRAPSRRASLSPTQEEAQRRQQRKRLPLEDSSQHSKTKLHSPQRGKVQDKWQQVSVMQGIVRLARKIPESWGLSR